MRIAGLVKSSLSDYPGKVSAVIFTQGCPLRCVFCHNRELVEPQYFQPCLAESSVLEFLKKRANVLDGVVITGGEPAVHTDLPAFLQQIRDIDSGHYAIKLDSSGVRPEILQAVIEAGLVDYLAMDVKAPPEKMQELTGRPHMTQRIEESIRIILSSELDHEFRTTFVPAMLNIDDLRKIGRMIAGAKRFALQEFIYHDSLSPALNVPEKVSLEQLRDIAEEIRVTNNIHEIDLRMS